MRLLVCGGRNYANRAKAFKALDKVDAKHGIDEILQGGAQGADNLAHEWAMARERVSIAVPAQWEQHGKRAGPIRNQRMLDEFKPNACVAFVGTRGTQDMCRRCQNANVPIWYVSEQVNTQSNKEEESGTAPE